MPSQSSSQPQRQHKPFTKQLNVKCLSGHIHKTNLPAAGLILCRLSKSSGGLEVLLRLRSSTADYPGTYGFPGGTADPVDEKPLDTARRGACGKFAIEPAAIGPMGYEYKRDHGGGRYMHYTYVFAEYESESGSEAPKPLTHGSDNAKWCDLNDLPRNLMAFVQEDIKMIRHVLVVEILPRLLEKQRMRRGPGSGSPALANLPVSPPGSRI